MKPNLNDIRRHLQNSIFRFLDDPVDEIIKQHGQSYLDFAQAVIDAVATSFPEKSWPDHFGKAFIRWNREILREEAYFKEVGAYRHENRSHLDLVDSVYGNQAVMESYYLDGLLLSYILWPHHYDLILFFRESFTRLLKPGAELIEFGCGHGLLSWIASLDTDHNLGVRGYDISSSAIAYATALHKEAPGKIEPHFSIGDAISDKFEPAEFLVCGELLEHVMEPALLLENIHRSLKPGGIAFITGALDAAQSDHVFRFEGKAELDGMILKQGFSILAQKTFIHPSRDCTDNPPSVVAYVLARN